MRSMSPGQYRSEEVDVVLDPIVDADLTVPREHLLVDGNPRYPALFELAGVGRLATARQTSE